MRRAFEIYGRGDLTLTALSHRLGREGRPISVSTLQRLLRNPFYAGILRWKGETFPGRHEPLVGQELFARVQSILDSRTRRLATSPTCNLWLRGFAKCAVCGSLMASEAHGHLGYYRCRRNGAKRDRCRAPFCNADRAEASVSDLYARIQLIPAVRRQLLEALRRRLTAEATEQTQNLAYVYGRLRRTEKSAVDLATSFADGLVDLDVYRLAARRLQDERQTLMRRMALLEANPAAREIQSDAATLAELDAHLPLDLRQYLLTIVFSDLRLRPDGIASYQLRPPFDVLDNHPQSMAA